MSKQTEFLEFLEFLISNCNQPVEMTDNVKLYVESLRNIQSIEKPVLTENGTNILQYMQATEQKMLKAKDIAEGLFISSRVVSGAIRKLVSDGFVEKVGTEPVIYTLTDYGNDYKIENKESK